MTSISSQSQITKMRSISSDLSTISRDILSIRNDLGSYSDKSIQIAQSKLEEMATIMNTISQSASSYADRIDSATREANEIIRREEREKSLWGIFHV